LTWLAQRTEQKARLPLREVSRKAVPQPSLAQARSRAPSASLVLLPWAVPVFRTLRPRSAGRLLAAGMLGLVGYNLPVTIAGTLPGAGLAHLGPAAWAELAFLAIGSTAAGMLLWNLAVLAGGLSRVSLLLYLEPAVSVLGAAVFLGERVTAAMAAGGALILAGVAVASTAQPRQPGPGDGAEPGYAPCPGGPVNPSAG
jgi:drug/metabolite transporter (DMT)-like permease